MNINFNLKEGKKEESLIFIFCRWNGHSVKLSTQHRIVSKTWNKTKQKCSISKSKFSDKVNSISEQANSFLDNLLTKINSEPA